MNALSDIKTKLTYWRNIVPWAVGCDFSLEAQVQELARPPFIDSVLKSLLPPEAPQNGALVDCKGCDRAFLLEKLPSEHEPREHELLRLVGRVFHSEEEIVRRQTKSLENQFEVSIVTPFKAFVGNHHIEHSSQLSFSADFPNTLAITDLGRGFPLEIDYMRFGLDFFQSSFLSKNLGFIPTVARSCCFDISSAKMRFCLRAEGLQSKNDPTQWQMTYFPKISSVFADTLGINLLELFKGAASSN